LSWLLLGWLLALISAEAAPSDKVSFNRDIRPILSDNCFNCHGPDTAKRKAGLHFGSRESATRPLESGHTAIVPGDPASSRMLAVLTTEDADDRMPPVRTGKLLRPEQVQLLKRWIERIRLGNPVYRG